ncbi:uncharacterized protein [Primulina eburnea]|uniref:uncharacterized protein n=1 Tax=Primulina eburnea TaxID=1245227 RepID=UPI003C6C5C4C
MTREELKKMMADAIAQAMVRKEVSQHNTPPEQEQEQEQEQERREEEEVSGGNMDYSVGSKAPTTAEELRELKQKMRVLEGQLESRSAARVVAKGCPFADIIVREPLPGNFRSAKVKDYDGNADQEEHLARIENMAMLHCYTDRIKCKVFLTTLVDSAQRWFEGLPPQSVHSFRDFQKSPEESLRAYIKRFNRVALDVPSCAGETKTTAFTQGLREGEFFKSLTKKVPGDFEDLLSRAEKYINMEEAQKQKREAVRKERGDRTSKPEERGQKRANPGHFSHHVPLKIAREREVQECSRDLAPDHQLSRPEKKGFCALHKLGYHNTEDCKVLKGNYVAPSLPKPIIKTQVSRLPPWTSRQPGSSSRGGGVRSNPRIEPGRRRGSELEQRKKSPPVVGTIKMISGGSTDGDSNRARKSRSRRECLEVEEGSRKSEEVISFGPEDLRGVNLPHNDALVIQAQVANYDILRVFVDSGSSVNVIFKDAFEQMDLQGYQLETVETALFGFAGHVVYTEGEIILPLTLGSHNLKRTVMTSFTMVDSPSSYNIILGRPAMNELRVVASTYHQKIKFPVGARVGEVRGDQPSSRKCYVEAVRADQSRSKKEGKRAKIGETGGRRVEKGEIHFVAEEEQEAVEIGLGQQIRVARDLSMTTRQELTGISPFISEHHLNILPGSHPMKQKKRHFGPEKDKVISEQVKELLKAGLPRSEQGGPKDHYPLPRIDQLVDSTSGYELLSFMDAYQRYHQIPLAKNDQDKASFVTSGGATYQRLMDKVFEKQLGRNVEVYVDDILGKTREVTTLINDLEETFATLMQYGIKLNPAKCIFGVKSGNS